MFRNIYIYRSDRHVDDEEFLSSSAVLVFFDRLRVSSSVRCDNYCLRLERLLNSMSDYYYKVIPIPLDRFRSNTLRQCAISFDDDDLPF